VWEQLTEELRESNRAQARHIGDKLTAIGCVIVPGVDDALPFSFQSDPDEVEQLARLEHQRWVRERLAQGYHYASVRGGLGHPGVLEWDALSDSVREKNRAFIRALPAVLAGAGFQMLRVHAGARTAVATG
jgi:hypothetical protein